MRILLTSPRSFCAGVIMAIEALDKTLELVGAPVYVYHEIIHNTHVVERFRSRGVVFVEELAEVPPGSVLLYSAHGVSPVIRQVARERRLRTIDATCPLVAKVHREALRFAREGRTIVLIGHEGHDEIVGIIGEAPDRIKLVEDVEDVERLELEDETRVAYLTQTTLSVSDTEHIIRALKERFPHIIGPARDDICYASQNRQEAVQLLAVEADVVLVLGSQNSSNSQRLRETAEARGKPAYLVDRPGDLRREWFRPNDVVVVTAGASAPEEVVLACVEFLCEQYGASVEHRTVVEEHMSFALPGELLQLSVRVGSR
jgi:4-hydroxy-3-methylbut-2-enyl diphosphate reductase